MLLLQHELVGWVKPIGGVRGEPLHPLKSVQPSLSKELYAGKTSYLQGLPWLLMGSFSPTHTYELLHCHPWATCTSYFDKSTLKTLLCCLMPAREGRRGWGRCWGCCSGLPGSAPHQLGGKGTHASAPRLPTLGDWLAGSVWSGAAASMVQKLMVASSLSIVFLLEKFLPVQMLISKCQGQSCTCFAPFPAAGLYLSTDFDLGLVLGASPLLLREAGLRMGYPRYEFIDDFQRK